MHCESRCPPIGIRADPAPDIATPLEAARRGVSRMLPDLRFVIGAVMATALLGVTLFGLAAAMHISHQSKVGPLEASRLLAYAPENRHRTFDMPARRFDNPFANIPAAANPVPLQQPADANPVPLQQPAQPLEPQAAPTQTAAAAQPAAQPENPPQPAASDADTVDERAVVDPPLPPDGDVPAAAAEAAPAAPSPEPEPSAASAPPIETQRAAPAPVAEKEIEPAADVPQVGSIPATTDVADTRDEPPASEVPSVAESEEPAPAKRKRAVRKAAKAKRPPARRAAVQPQPADPFASTGYQLSTTSTANRPAKGFWPID
jgi:hypothetical protein